MTNSDKSTKSDSNNINTKWFVVFLCLIVSIVIGCYFFEFNDRLSDKNEVWGAFGDYVGGILNPVIAAFAFYLIAKTYELQKRELEATRSLLEISTDAQKEQIKLAALTAALNSNLTNIGILQTDKSDMLKEFITHASDKDLALRVKFLGNIPFGMSPEDKEYDKFAAQAFEWDLEYKELMEEISKEKGEYYEHIILKVIESEREIYNLMSENRRIKKNRKTIALIYFLNFYNLTSTNSGIYICSARVGPISEA